MKSVLLSIVMIVLASCFVSGGLYAHWSDVEASEGNEFVSGSLDLKVNGVDEAELTPIVMEDLKPCCESDGRWVLSNSGSTAGIASLSPDYVSDFENGISKSANNPPLHVT